MFLIECPHCQRRELRGYRGLRSLTNTADGILLTADCTACGHTVTMRTGRPTASTPGAPVPAAPDGPAPTSRPTGPGPAPVSSPRASDHVTAA